MNYVFAFLIFSIFNDWKLLKLYGHAKCLNHRKFYQPFSAEVVIWNKPFTNEFS